MKTGIKSFLLAIALLAMPSLLMAKDIGWIRSVPNVVVEDQVYRVNIQRINGKNPMPAHRYAVDAGEASIRVSLILESQWAPKLKRIHHDIFSQEFKMNVEAGTTYIIGGKVDPDASKEEQDDGTFWRPTIYEKSAEE